MKFNPPHFNINDHGNNENLKVSILTEQQMMSLGFTDFNKLKWSYYKPVGGTIRFSLDVNKDLSDFQIDVLDDDFGQPYDYQHYLTVNPQHEFAAKVWREVEKQMEILADAGVISGHERGNYI